MAWMDDRSGSSSRSYRWFSGDSMCSLLLPKKVEIRYLGPPLGEVHRACYVKLSAATVLMQTISWTRSISF